MLIALTINKLFNKSFQYTDVEGKSVARQKSKFRMYSIDDTVSYQMCGTYVKSNIIFVLESFFLVLLLITCLCVCNSYYVDYFIVLDIHLLIVFPNIKVSNLAVTSLITIELLEMEYYG